MDGEGLVLVDSDVLMDHGTAQLLARLYEEHVLVPSPSQEPRLLHTCPFASVKQASQLLPYLYIKCKGNTKEKKKKIGWEI